MAERLISATELQRASTQLTAAQSAFDQLLAQRARFAHGQLRLITELPVFRALLTDGVARDDRPTMNAMAEHYRQQLGADAALVRDARGRLIGSAIPEGEAIPLDFDVSGSEAERARVIDRAGQLYVAVTEPAMFADEPLGAIAAAYRIDDAMSRELARLSQTDVAFLVDGRVPATSVGTATRPTLSALMSGPPPAGGVRSVRLGARSYVVTNVELPLASARGRPAPAAALALMVDWGPTEALIARMRAGLFWTTVGTFGFGVGAMVFMSRRVSRHMAALSSAARAIAAGAWEQRAREEGPREAVHLARAFNDMTAALVHWHEAAEARLAGMTSAYQRFSAVAEHAGDAILSVNASGIVTWCNPGAGRLFEGDTERLVGASSAGLVAPTSRARYEAQLERLIGGGAEMAVTLEAEALTLGGTPLVVEASLAQLTGPDGRGVIAVMRDVTARVEAHRLLEAARVAAEQANRAKGAFLANMSHELRTPLNAVIGYSELLAEEAVLSGRAESTDDLERIRAAGKHLLTLIDNVLDLSRIEAGKVSLDPVTFDVAAVVREVEFLAQPLAAKRGNTVIVELSPGLGEMTSDPTRLRQVLLNLVSNAAKFTRDGEIALAVAREPSGGRDDVTFRVRDTGIGMTPNQMARVFDEFTQADDSTTREYGGTGLGLTISRRLCQLLGGTIGVSSTIGEGSTFTVRLPAAVPAVSDAARAVLA